MIRPITQPSNLATKNQGVSGVQAPHLKHAMIASGSFDFFSALQNFLTSFLHARATGSHVGHIMPFVYLVN